MAEATYNGVLRLGRGAYLVGYADLLPRDALRVGLDDQALFDRNGERPSDPVRLTVPAAPGAGDRRRRIPS
jgi:hypothetical protein